LRPSQRLYLRAQSAEADAGRLVELNLDKVDVYGSPIDRIYVWRRTQNVDRKIRRKTQTGLEPIHVPAVEDFFCAVRDHLRDDWAAPEDWDSSGVLK
jgi:hypothetical protein